MSINTSVNLSDKRFRIFELLFLIRIEFKYIGVFSCLYLFLYIRLGYCSSAYYCLFVIKAM